MDEMLNDAAGIEVEELVEEAFEPTQDAFEPIVPDAHQRWQGQLRRAGSARELPGPQRYRDYPVWLTEPHKHPAREQALAA